MANPYFNATYYLTNNPDVFAAGINTVEGAWEHYVNHGAAESLAGASSRKPAPWFDASYYLTNNPDLSTAGLTAGQLFEHFTVHGISEGRAPSADAVLTEESLLKYALANEDLLEAFDIADDATELTDAQALALASQFYSHGYMESRPDAPFEAEVDPGKVGATFTLTTGLDFADTATAFLNGTIPSNFKFTDANEKVEALAGTLQATDVLIDGTKTDGDTLTVRANAGNELGGGGRGFGTVTNIENIAVINTNVAAQTLNLANVTGLQTLTVSGTQTAAGSITNVGRSGVTTIDLSGITTTGANGGVSVTQGTTAATAAMAITGGAGNDSLTGGDGDDTLVGGAGNDTLVGGKGNDTLDGGAGNDTLTGGQGNDTFIIAAGTDTVTDLSTGDTFTVSGTATMNATVISAFVATSDDANSSTGAANANLTLAAPVGAATGGTIDMSQATGAFTIAGNTGNDTLNGGAGNDTINGGAGNDTINGGAGNDTINGGAGNDTINGGAGNDIITGGVGVDALTGGEGNDTFVFATGDTGGTAATADVITDFNVGDKIDLSGLTSSLNGVLGATKATVLNGNAATVGVAGLNDANFDAWVATVGGTDYLVYETAADGSATEIIAIGSAAGTLANWDLTGGVITAVA